MPRRRSLIVCALVPRFALRVAAGMDGSLPDEPVALGPEPGGHCMAAEARVTAGVPGGSHRRLPRQRAAYRPDGRRRIRETATFVAMDGGRRWARMRMLLESACRPPRAIRTLRPPAARPCDVAAPRAESPTAFAAVPAPPPVVDTATHCQGRRSLLEVEFGHARRRRGHSARRDLATAAAVVPRGFAGRGLLEVDRPKSSPLDVCRAPLPRRWARIHRHLARWRRSSSTSTYPSTPGQQRD
jgi:hypothetical protein